LQSELEQKETATTQLLSQVDRLKLEIEAKQETQLD
jgi:hypothetical protein